MPNARLRIPLFNPERMQGEQARVYNEIVSGPRGRLVGPLRAILHHPELADRWQQFGEVLRYRTSLPKALVELAILVTARRWTSQVEWYVHAREALAAGLSADVIQSVREALVPDFDSQDAHDVYEFTRQLQQTGNVNGTLYDRILGRWGIVGIVELGSLIGYYTMVSMTLNVHDIPVPDDDGKALPLTLFADEDGLVTLPAANLIPHGAESAK